jgi:hypothetical protein
VKTTLSNRDRLRQVRLAICDPRRQVVATRLEAAAGSDNPYAFIEVFGRGHLSTCAGAAVYITRCNPVSVQPRAVVNCTSEVPVMFNGTEMFIDLISYVLQRCTYKTSKDKTSKDKTSKDKTSDYKTSTTTKRRQLQNVDTTKRRITNRRFCKNAP